MRTGLHRSPFHGYSAEFSQYRHYRPGDDLKYVDWKLLARTDRLYTRQYRETTDLVAQVIVDASGSMGFTGGAAPSKLAVAAMAAGALALLLSRQGDAVGLEAHGTAAAIPPRTGPMHLRRILAALARLHAGGRGDAAGAVRRAADSLGRPGLLLVLGDFYDEEARLLGELRRARRIGHDVAVLQILSDAELAFPFRGDAEFVDLETGARVHAHASDVGAGYRDGVSAFVERLRGGLHRDGIDHALIVTSAPLDEALRSLLLRRR